MEEKSGGSAPDLTLGGLAAALPALAASCGPVRLVAVDGHAGSGKTTLAGRLAERLGGAPVVHLDDLATHEEPFGWTGRLAAQVLGPLAGAAPPRTRCTTGPRGGSPPGGEIPAAPVVLLEGVGAGRAQVRPHLALSCGWRWTRTTARRRGLRRDGPQLAHFWTGWSRGGGRALRGRSDPAVRRSAGPADAGRRRLPAARVPGARAPHRPATVTHRSPPAAARAGRRTRRDGSVRNGLTGRVSSNYVFN